MGGGKAGNRQEFDVKSIPLVEGLIEYTCPGDGAIDFFSREAESDSWVWLNTGLLKVASCRWKSLPLSESFKVDGWVVKVSDQSRDVLFKQKSSVKKC